MEDRGLRMAPISQVGMRNAKSLAEQCSASGRGVSRLQRWRWLLAWFPGRRSRGSLCPGLAGVALSARSPSDLNVAGCCTPVVPNVAPLIVDHQRCSGCCGFLEHIIIAHHECPPGDRSGVGGQSKKAVKHTNKQRNTKKHKVEQD